MKFNFNSDQNYSSDKLYLFFVEFCFALLFVVPWIPETMAADVRDAAYTIMSHVAFANGQPWGASGLHTSGPWSFINFPVYLEQTYFTLITANILLAFTVSIIITQLAVNSINSVLLRVIFCFSMTWVLSLANDTAWLFLIMSSQIFLPNFSNSKRWTIAVDWQSLQAPFIICLLTAALACSIKGTFMFFGIVLFVELVALELMARRLPLVAFFYASTVILIATFAGFTPNDWLTHLRFILESISGYSETFSMFGSIMELILFFVILIVFLVITLLHELDRRSGFRGVMLWLVIAAFLWLNYKGAFTRQDEFHVIRCVAAFLAFGVAYLISLPLWHLRLASKASMITTFAVACAFIIIDSGVNTQLNLFIKRVSSAAEFVKHGTSQLSLRDLEVRRKIAKAAPLKLPDGATIGVFGTYQSPIEANSLSNTPLGVIAAYEIWTPYTVDIQRRFFEGPSSPDYLLYTSSPRSAEVAVQLAKHYEPYSQAGSFPVLKRRTQFLNFSEHLVFEGEINLLNAFEIPSNWRQNVAIIDVEYNKTLLGSLISFLYQPPQAYLNIESHINPPATVRMNQRLSGKGIVLASKPGIWNSDALRLHGIQFDPLTEVKTEATKVNFTAIGPFGTDWSTYFAKIAHVRVRLLDFSEEL